MLNPLKIISVSLSLFLVACGGGGSSSGGDSIRSRLQGTWYGCFGGYLEEYTIEDTKLTLRDYEAENPDCTGSLEPYDVVVFSVEYGDSFRDDNNFTALEIDTTVEESTWDAFPVGEKNYDIVGVEKGCLLLPNYNEFFNGESPGTRPVNLDASFAYGKTIENDCASKFIETRTLDGSPFNESQSGLASGELEPEGIDTWEFELTESGTITITSFDSEFDPECALQDKDLGIIDQSDDFGDSLECRVSSTLSPGKYYFRIIGFDRGATEFGEYSLGFEFVR